MVRPGHLLACSPSALSKHSRQEGRSGFILVHGLLPRDSSHPSGCLNGGVSGRTMGQGGERGMQLGWPRCGRSGDWLEALGVWRPGKESAAASAPSLVPAGLVDRGCCWGPGPFPKPVNRLSSPQEPTHSTSGPASERTCLGSHSDQDRQKELGSRALGVQGPGLHPWIRRELLSEPRFAHP